MRRSREDANMVSISRSGDDERVFTAWHRGETITKDLIKEGRQLWNNTRAKLDDYGNECLAKCSKDDINDERLYELIVRI